MAPAPAYAGAWVAPEEGQSIWTNHVGERNELTYYESATYWEAPYEEDTSVLLNSWVEQSYENVEGWRAEGIIGVKHAIFRDDETVIALQAGALWCSEGGAEVRLLAGRSFENGAFLNVEAATRALEGGCAGERVDVTGGARIAENWMALGQVFLDAPHEGEETVKAQFSLVRFGENGRGIQLGVRARIDGGAEEPALVLGSWGPAGDDD